MFTFYCAICCSKLSVWIPICEFSYLCPLHNFDMNVQIARGKDRRDTFLAQLWQGFHWMSAFFSLQLTTERQDGICRYFLCTEDHLKSQMSFSDLFFINWACISLLPFVVSLTYWSESFRKIDKSYFNIRMVCFKKLEKILCFLEIYPKAQWWKESVKVLNSGFA